MLVLVVMAKCSFHSAVASPAMQEFWQQLTKAEVQGDFLRLVEGTYFLGNKRLGNMLMVRRSYVDLHNIILNHHETGGRVITITGSPGQLTCVFCSHLCSGRCWLLVLWLYLQAQPGCAQQDMSS